MLPQRYQWQGLRQKICNLGGARMEIYSFGFFQSYGTIMYIHKFRAKENWGIHFPNWLIYISVGTSPRDTRFRIHTASSKQFWYNYLEILAVWKWRTSLVLWAKLRIRIVDMMVVKSTYPNPFKPVASLPNTRVPAHENLIRAWLINNLRHFQTPSLRGADNLSNGDDDDGMWLNTLKQPCRWGKAKCW